MRLAIFPLLAALAAADTLPDLVQQFEPCAVLCYDAACDDSGCLPGDFSCVCGNPASLVVKMGICVGNACDGSQPFDAGALLANICTELEDKPPSSEIAAASVLIVSEISSVAATATSNPVPPPTSTNHAAAMTEAPVLGLIGVAAVAALVL